MAKSVTSLLAFNRGIVSKRGLARTDLTRMQLAAETQKNYVPRVLGSMMLRPGLQYIGASNDNAVSVYLPFFYGVDDTALVELADSAIRVWVDDALVSRVSVSTAVANGSFTSNANSWTDNDESGATSQWVSGGYLSLAGTGINAAIRDQQVTVAGGDQNKEHALRIVVERGPVMLRVGSTSGGDEYITETSLGRGTHSLAFTPTGNFYIRFFNLRQAAALVDSCTIEASGVMELPLDQSSLADRRLVRWDQSADVMFLACKGYRQRKIERRGTRSWSYVRYEPENGPYLVENTGPATISPSAISGDVTLTASRALFRSGHVGALFRISSIGQKVELTVNGENQWTSEIRVSGVGVGRRFIAVNQGSGTATITLQRSIGEPGAWADVQPIGPTAGYNYNDSLDNQIAYYRIGCKTGDYSSGTRDLSLEYSAGSIDGVVRITGISSATSATASVLTSLGGTDASSIWAEGAWSSYRGYPSAVALYEGRLWWAGRDRIWGSITDAFENFDPTFEGDGGPVSRSIGSGPVDTINWLLPLQRLFLGCESAEKSARSSSFDEPLTPTNFNLKDVSTQGSANVPPLKIDTGGIFTQRNAKRLYELAYDTSSFDYAARDLTGLVPDLLAAGVVRVAVQRQPDTRVHVVLADGTAAMLIFDRLEDVVCWITVETDGTIYDATVLPGDDEDDVYYEVGRTVGGNEVVYLEKWAAESECVGGLLNKQADSFIVYDSTSTTTITGLSHLEGRDVIAWGDGTDFSPGSGDDQTTFTVSSGSITLPSAVSKAVVGLPYDARYKSRKLIEGGGLTQRKRVDHLGLLLENTHAQGISFGPDFDTMDDMPLVERGADVDQDSIWDEYDSDSVEFPGEWHTDSRICLKSNAPRPCTVLAAVAVHRTEAKGE